ncbi:Phosphoglucomutase-2 [Conglomerata obtusa]
MNEEEENEILYQTFQYLKYDKDIESKEYIYKLLRHNKYDELKTIMLRKLEFKDGHLIAKVGPGWSQLNKVTICIIAKAVATTMTKNRMFMAVNHPKTFLSRDVVPKESIVYIGFDVREKSKQFAFLIAEVLYKYNYYIRMPDKPSLAPFISYMAGCSMYRFGIMITGYPHPSNYNGIIIYLEDGCKITEPFYNQINLLLIKKEIYHLQHTYKNLHYDFSADITKFVKHFLFGTGTAMDQYYKNVQLRKERRVVVSCMFGPYKKFFDIAINIYELKGIFCFYPEHAIQDPNLGNHKFLFPNETFLEPGLIEFANYYKSDYIIFLNTIGTQFRIASRRIKGWYFYSIDDIASLFMGLYHKNASPLDTMVINTYENTNMGALMSMKYGFRYYRAKLGTLNTQDSYCQYKQKDVQIDNYFVYNNNFEFINYYGKEGSSIHLSIIFATYIQYELPDVEIRRLNNIFGNFKLVKKTLLTNNVVKFFDNFRIEVKKHNYEIYDKYSTIEFFTEKYVYVIFTKLKDSINIYVYFDRVTYNDPDNYVNNLLKKLNIENLFFI